MINIKLNDMGISLDENSLRYSIRKGIEEWQWQEGYEARIECEEETLLFKNALNITHTQVKNGLGEGILSRYEGFKAHGTEVPYTFETFAWIEGTTGTVTFEWMPICEEGLKVKAVYWPGEMEFTGNDASFYTLIPMQQGILIPNTWEKELGALVFDGFFGTAGAYMPWFSQIRGRAGYIAICTTPWNAGYQAEHPANGPYTHVGVRFELSLGSMEYKRVIQYVFNNDCDYNDMCKTYRSYVREQGKLRTLNEKAAKIPSVDKLIGCSFVHTGIKTSVKENSDFFDPEAPDINNHLTTFAEREKEVKAIHKAGVEKLYLHLDGWAQPGYDNQHPDYSPACEEAGGWAGMKSLVDTMHECGYMFGIHDQYRDYYMDAPSFDEEYACRLTDGTIPSHQRWAGGPQSYLCATQAPSYVKRNFTVLKEHNIDLDGAYLDVFTCNEGDECGNPHHRMTRRDCYDYRNLCFEYLLSQGILTSSEEVNEWAIPSLVFSHYAPYDFMLREPGKPKYGVPVPLYSLVYHDCTITPWMMEKVSDTEDYMLYALLNGGAPYLIRDGAYPNFDGSFEGAEELHLEEDIARCNVVAKLHEKVAKCEMIKHEMINGDYNVQRTTFADGTAVTVDFNKLSYEIN